MNIRTLHLTPQQRQLIERCGADLLDDPELRDTYMLRVTNKLAINNPTGYVSNDAVADVVEHTLADLRYAL